MSAEIIIAEWKKNEREVVRVRLDTFKDRPIVDCREWYKSSDGTFKPGRDGLTVSIRHLPSLANALAKAMETAIAVGQIAEYTQTNDS